MSLIVRFISKIALKPLATNDSLTHLFSPQSATLCYSYFAVDCIGSAQLCFLGSFVRFLFYIYIFLSLVFLFTFQFVHQAQEIPEHVVIFWERIAIFSQIELNWIYRSGNLLGVFLYISWFKLKKALHVKRSLALTRSDFFFVSKNYKLFFPFFLES